ncbi:hypothetical protein HY382_03010 [Candidatus Curtissbacteria bacterium]|nr:hypothetical protein [Candidatus Curtissbacteria bacterium]
MPKSLSWCYYLGMIIAKETPYTKEEIKKLQKEFQSYIKTVIDIKKKICSAGANRHFESKQLLLKQNSNQSDLWGGGIDLETKIIDYNSFINIRPNDNNTSNEIQSDKIKKEYERLTRYFFKEII